MLSTVTTYAALAQRIHAAGQQRTHNMTLEKITELREV